MAGTISGPLTFVTAGKRVPAYLQEPLRWPLAGGWDALAAGTHRSRPDESGDAVPLRPPGPGRSHPHQAHAGSGRGRAGVGGRGLDRGQDDGLLRSTPCTTAGVPGLAPDNGPDLLTPVEAIDHSGG